MKRIKLGLLFVVFLLCVSVQAQRGYGFLTGTNNMSLSVGLYSFNSENGQNHKLERSAMYAFWGGAGDGKTYYCLLSNDYDGYQMAGLAAYDFATQQLLFRANDANYGCTDMTYDHSTSTMYGVVCMQGGTKVQNYLAKINLANGQHTKVADLEDKIMAIACSYDGKMYAMGITSNFYRLNKQNGELTLIGNNGENIATDQVQSLEFDHDTNRLYWMAIDSYLMTFYAEVNVQDGSLISYNSTPDNTLLGGIYIPFTSPGSGGQQQMVDVVQNLEAVPDGNDVVLTWTDNNPEGTQYRITRAPDGYSISGITGHTYRDAEIAEPGFYTYSVCAYNDFSDSPETTSNTVVAGQPLQIPCSFDLKGGAAKSQWLLVDANQDKTTWTLSPQGLSYFCSFYNDADDWAFSLPMELLPDVTYRLRYTVNCQSILGSKEDFRMTLGRDVAPGSHKQTIDAVTSYATEGFVTRETAFSVQEQGRYTLGVQALSKADQFQILIGSLEIDLLVNKDLNVRTIAGDFLANQNKPCEVFVSIENTGKEVVRHYVVELLDQQQNVLAVKNVEREVSAGLVDTVALSFVPAAAGQLSLSARVKVEGDENPLNDLSKPMHLTVLDEKDAIVRIGKNTHSPSLFPFSFEGFYYNYSQSIYLAEEINVSGGYISDVYYYYNNRSNQDLLRKPVRLYMGNTWFASSLDGWVGFSELTKVFDGFIDLKDGEHYLHYSIEKPFAYNGGNLCIMNEKHRDGTIANVTFRGTEDEDAIRSVYISNDNGAIDMSEAIGSYVINDIYLVIRPGEIDHVNSAIVSADTLKLRHKGNNVYEIPDRASGIEVIAADGRRVIHISAQGTSVLRLGGLPQGVYLVRVMGENAVSTQKIFVR